SRRRHTRFSRDWSSDVCSSDLLYFESIGFIISFVILGKFLEERVKRRARQELRDIFSLGAKEVLAKRGDQFVPVPLEELVLGDRSEERRVGKECGSRWCCGPA